MWYSRRVPVETSHIMHWLSTEPDIKNMLSGDQAKSKTSLRCNLQTKRKSETPWPLCRISSSQLSTSSGSKITVHLMVPLDRTGSADKQSGTHCNVLRTFQLGLFSAFSTALHNKISPPADHKWKNFQSLRLIFWVINTKKNLIEMQNCTLLL